MPAVKSNRIFGWVKVSMTSTGALVLIGCVRLTPLPPVKPAVDMFSVYDGRPSTAAEREEALNDCYAYLNTTPALTTVPQANQICMLQLGFRAPLGELPGRSSSWIDPGGACVTDPYMPVCWAVKYGWPQDPPPRWSRQGASLWNLSDEWGACYYHYLGVPYPRLKTVLDKCMEQKYGYTVVHLNSPIVPWLPRKYWPTCKKLEVEMNWLEKKWCPDQQLLPPPPAAAGQ